MALVNTVDIIGDEALASSIIDKSVTIIVDNATKSLGIYSLWKCVNLITADFASLTYIGKYALESCKGLIALVLRSETMCTIYDRHAAGYSSIATGTGFIYVPRVLIDSYKTDSNWSTYAAQFRALEDYTVDGTTTGELDPTKI